jgi:hypothetical protein
MIRWFQMAAAVLVKIALGCGVALACDLSMFDKTSPTAVKDRVDNHFAKFEWASDADASQGQFKIWNYIHNLGNAGLGADWDKGRIHIPVANPLPPGKPFCYRYLADLVTERPDADAPIIYGTNKQRQDAAAYVPRQQAQSTIRSKSQRHARRTALQYSCIIPKIS